MTSFFLALALAAGPVDRAAALEAAADAAAARGDAAAAAADLWRAGEAADHEARDYARAIRLYDRLIAEHPSARLSRSAAARREVVARATAFGEEPFRRFESLRARFASLERAAAIAEAEAIAESFPDFPLGDELALWIADRAAEAGRAGDARQGYERVIARWPDGAAAGHALAALARLHLASGEFASAEATYRRLAESALPGASTVATQELAALRTRAARDARGRAAGWVAVVAGLMAAAAIDPRRLRGAIRRSLGRELLYVAPILGVLVWLAPPPSRGGVAWLALTGLLLVWAAVVWAESARRAWTTPRGRAWSAGGAALASTGLLFAVLHRLDLVAAVERWWGAP